MQGITMIQPGDETVLQMQDLPLPIASAGELLIKVKAAAVNRTDIMTRENTDLPAPYPILGVEIAGIVVENHSDDVSFAEGTRVCGLVNHGGYAEYVTMPADRAIIMPESLSFSQAAAIPEVFLTAYQTIYWLGQLQEQEKILIHAGASGVGTAAIQLVKQLTQAEVFVTAGSNEKLQFCQNLGADVCINYKTQDFATEILDATDGEGVDLILDFVGAQDWQKNAQAISQDGRWILIGTLGGHIVPEVDLMTLIQKRLTLKGTLLTLRSDVYKAKLTQEFIKKVLPLFEEEKIHPIVDSIISLDNVQHAHKRMVDNLNIGKIVLKVGN